MKDGNRRGKSVVVVGAGATGRGHVAQLASESGYNLVLLDKDEALCRALADAGSYSVRLVSAHTRTVTVAGYSVFHTSQLDAFYPLFRDASLVFTAVCPGNLPDAADSLRGLFVRWLQEDDGSHFKNVLCCENMNRSSRTFRELLLSGFPDALRERLEKQVGFADTMVARVVAKPSKPLELLGEEYSEWTADRTALRGPELPAIRTLELVEDQTRFLQRKLYIHNAGHATIGYLGFLKGYRYIHEAGQDPEIMEVCKKAIEESGWAIEKEYGFPADVIAKYRDALTDKCVSSELPDEIVRVVREPLRKLGPEERFFGPIGLMLKHGRQPEYLLYGVCAALLAKIPNDVQSEEIASLLESYGASCLIQITGAPMSDSMVSRVAAFLMIVRARFVKNG
jgi:mannitol-1-phosphate 5-dehydrogenase